MPCLRSPTTSYHHHHHNIHTELIMGGFRRKSTSSAGITIPGTRSMIAHAVLRRHGKKETGDKFGTMPCIGTTTAQQGPR